MKRIFLCTTAAVVTLFTSIPASAQYDPTLFCNWTGFYAGLSIGGVWQKVNNSLSVVNDPVNDYFFPPAIAGVNTSGSSSLDDSKVFGGGQLGYNMQMGNAVWGLELGISDLNTKANHGGRFLYTTNNDPYNLTTSAATHWLFSLRPRVGWAVNNALLYVTGGLAVAQLKFNQSFSEPPFTPTPENASYSKTKAGWTLGGGVEFALNNCWSVKAEYLYNRFNSDTVVGHLVNGGDPIAGFVFGATFNNSLSNRNISMLSAGINYHFI
jgi:outer membrane immunogenic protein